MGIEPTPSAWKAEVLPLNYTRKGKTSRMVEGEGFEPSKAEPSDLQSDTFDRSGTPPVGLAGDYREMTKVRQPFLLFLLSPIDPIQTRHHPGNITAPQRIQLPKRIGHGFINEP